MNNNRIHKCVVCGRLFRRDRSIEYHAFHEHPEYLGKWAYIDDDDYG
jgi:hypothetical protein